MVLPENNGYLPLKEGTTVALFGIGTMEYIKGGGIPKRGLSTTAGWGGIECKANGLACWLTPTRSIRRNALCGRNFEYFREDP